MARARGRKKSGSGASFGSVLVYLKGASLVLAGVLLGYCWRSYLPLALPFESPLVADKQSDDVGADELRAVVKASEDRARKAERERDSAKAELQRLQDERVRAERDLADMHIKAVLEGTED